MNVEIDYPDAWLASQERRELIRIAAVNALKNPRLDPASLTWAQFWSKQPALVRPLGTGETQ